VAIPLIWPEVLSRHEVMSWISAPLPPPPIQEVKFPHVRPTRPWIRSAAISYPPSAVHQVLPALDEPPSQPPGVVGATGDDLPGTLGPIMDSVIRIEAPKRPADAAPTAAQKAAPAPVQQIKVSSTIQAARLIHRIDPIYPPLARQMRISGTVELVGVISTDGTIRELRVFSGHPLLVQAALNAVRQWAYQPTLLGGHPVEVITTISVIFRLN
jgi:protein TonB